MSVLVEPKVIKIKKIKRPGVFGIDSYSRSTTTIGAELAHMGGHNTGLTAEDQQYFEKELNLKPGDLKSHSIWWSEVFNTQHALRLKNSKTNELIIDNPLNELRYKILLASTKIANSESEKSKPYCEFYIDDEAVKAKQELEQLDLEYKSMELIFKMTPEEKRGALRLFGKKGLEDMSESIIGAQLAKELKTNPKQFYDIITDKNIQTKSFIKELEEYAIIDRKNGTFNYGDDTLATTTEDAVAYFNDLKNQSVKLTIETKLKKAKSKPK